MAEERQRGLGVQVDAAVVPAGPAGCSTIDGIADDTVIGANVATHIQPSVVTIRPDRLVWTSSTGCSAAANSATNGLPTSIPASVASKIPALLSVRSSAEERLAQREGQHGEDQNHCDGSEIKELPPPARHTSQAQAGGGDRERDQHGGGERNVTDKDPIPNPRRETNSMPMLGQCMSRSFAVLRRQAQVLVRC